MSQKNLIFFGLLAAILLLNCKGQGKEEELTFDELSPASRKYTEGDSLKTEKTKAAYFFDSLSPFLRRFIDSMGLPHTNISDLDTLIFPDRFGAIKTEKWAVKTSDDSLVFMYWKFKDSVKTENTFFNWIDCYGSRCVSIHVGENKAFSKRGHLFLVQGQYFFSIESNKKIDLERILSFFDHENWEKQRKFIVIQQARKKASWKKRDKAGELLDYQN